MRRLLFFPFGTDWRVYVDEFALSNSKKRGRERDLMRRRDGKQKADGIGGAVVDFQKKKKKSANFFRLFFVTRFSSLIFFPLSFSFVTKKGG